jgi:hypothetical protein
MASSMTSVAFEGTLAPHLMHFGEGEPWRGREQVPPQDRGHHMLLRGLTMMESLLEGLQIEQAQSKW